MTRISVVVPVHNEVENIPQLIDELQKTFSLPSMEAYQPWEVLLVEDESTDGTAEIIDDLASEHDHIKSIHLKRSYGQSAALAAGFDNSKGEIIVPMDGDLQNDPQDIPVLLDKLEEGYDCVSGWRKDRHDPWSKRLPSAIQTRLAKLTGPEINDFGCTLKVYRSEALEDIDLYGEGHRYIPAKLYDKGYSVTEVEVNHRERKYGNSRYGLGRLIRGFVDLLFHVFWVRYSTCPLHVLGGAGILSMAAGGLFGTLSLVQRFVFNMPLESRTPRLILVALLVIFGLQLFIFGILAEMMTKIHYQSTPEYRIDQVTE